MAALEQAPRVSSGDPSASSLRAPGDAAMALEQQPLLERRILFHPAKSNTFASQVSLPPGIEPLNQGFEQTAAAPREEKGTKRLWQEANGASHKQQQNAGKQHDDDLVADWGAPLRIGAGLNNLGNTCFLNSVLQCLTYTPPLAKFLESGQHRSSCHNSGFCAVCALEGHVKTALRSWGKVISPNYLVKNLRSISRAFQPWRQEDAHEYLRYLMEALHKACLPSKTANNPSDQEKSLVYRIFGGRLRSQVKCTDCLQCSDTVDPFLDLSLDIMRADSLGKALACFTGVEILDGENKYHCAKCKKKVRAFKRFTIDTAPNILTIQFKRFSSTGLHGQKIDKKVHFGKTLDTKPFMSNARDGAVYELYGVLVHAGWSTRSGHYYCYVRTSSDMWYILDDNRVKQVSEQHVLDQKAYILFYIRKSKLKVQSFSKQSVMTRAPQAKSPVKPKLIADDVSPDSQTVSALKSKIVADEGLFDSQAPSSLKPKLIADEVSLTTTASAALSLDPKAAASDISPSPGTTLQPVQLLNRLSEPPTSSVTETPVPQLSNVPRESCEPTDGTEVLREASPVKNGSSSPVCRKATEGSCSKEDVASRQASFALNEGQAEETPVHNKSNGLPQQASNSELLKNGKVTSSEKVKSRSHDSPRKLGGCMKILKAMPKSRRFFMARALDLNLSDRVETPPALKRRKLTENGDVKQKSTANVSSKAQPSDAGDATDSGEVRVEKENGNGTIGTTPVPVQSAQSVQPAALPAHELFGSGVARWDGVDGQDVDKFLTTEHKIQPRKLDEWDEEYDRGKVKKVRRGAGGGRLTPCKTNDGSSQNPFQVLAENKQQK